MPDDDKARLGAQAAWYDKEDDKTIFMILLPTDTHPEWEFENAHEKCIDEVTEWDILVGFVAHNGGGCPLLSSYFLLMSMS